MEKTAHLKRINRALGIFFLLLISLLGCEKESLEDLSRLTIESENNFVVSSIQQGPNNQILCIGNIRDTDSTIVRRYDRSLKLIEQHELGSIPELNGKLVLKYIMNSGWLISSTTRKPDFTTLTLYKTDEKFRITHTKELVNMKNINSSFMGYVNVNNELVLKNGDYLIVCDTVSWVKRTSGGIGNDFGINIFRLDPELNLRYAPFTGGQNTPTSSSEPLATELDDGSIFYLFYGNSMVYSGIIEANGNLRYQNGRVPDLPQSKPISLSNFRQEIVLNTTVNAIQLQYYTVLDPSSGSILKEASLPINTINSGLLGPNPISIGDNDMGQVLYTEDKKKMKFISVNENVQITEKFDLLLPKFETIFSYRQMYSADGNILIGISYDYKGKGYFNLQELSTTGALVN